MRRLRTRLHGDEGVTLVEVLVGVTIMAVALSIASVSAVHAMRVQRRQVAEVDAVARGRIVLERMTREIRAANPLMAASADGTTITVQVTRPVTGFNRKITTYQLVGDTIQMSGSVVNTATMATQTVPAHTILRGVTLSPGETLFSYRMLDGSTPGVGADLRQYRTVTINVRMAMPEVSSTVLISDTVTIRNSATQ